MKKRATILIIFLMILFSFSRGKTVVFPFKVSLREDISLQWLGKAASLYIKCGFKLNHVDTFRSEETDMIMRNFNIRFPYNISKAILIKIAMNIGASHLIWGEISTPEHSTDVNSGEIVIKSFAIDLVKLKQKYFPIIKGNPGNIFLMEQKLFEHIMKFLKNRGNIIFPNIEFDKSGYETYVKAMLLTDYQKRAELLEKIDIHKDRGSDLLNLELAKSFFFTNSKEKAEKYLDNIGENSYLKGEKFFLKGIIEYFKGQTGESMKYFSRVLKTTLFRSQALNNFGVLTGINHQYKESLKYLKESLSIRKSEEAFINTIFIYVLDKNNNEAKNTLFSALKIYPYSEDLKNILKNFLKNFPLKSEIADIFSKYIPGFSLDDRISRINFKIINPFIPSIEDFNGKTDIGYQYNGANEDSDPVMNRINRELWKYPFSPNLYFSGSQLLIKNKQFYSALNYAACALFLKESRENYSNVMSLLEKLGRDKELAVIRRKAQIFLKKSSGLSSDT